MCSVLGSLHCTLRDPRLGASQEAGGSDTGCYPQAVCFLLKGSQIDFECKSFRGRTERDGNFLCSGSLPRRRSSQLWARPQPGARGFTRLSRMDIGAQTFELGLYFSGNRKLCWKYSNLMMTWCPRGILVTGQPSPTVPQRWPWAFHNWFPGCALCEVEQRNHSGSPQVPAVARTEAGLGMQCQSPHAVPPRPCA